MTLRNLNNTILLVKTSNKSLGSQSSLIRTSGVKSFGVLFLWFFNWFSSFSVLHTIKEQSRLNKKDTNPEAEKVSKFSFVNPRAGEPSIVAFDKL